MSRSTALSSRVFGPRYVFGALLVAVFSGLAFLPARLLMSAELSGPKPADRNITQIITRLIEREHLTRHPLDNEISHRWMTNYMKMLDPRKVFFSQSDIDSFNVYRDQLDDMAIKGDTSFAYQVFNKFLERIDDRVRLVDELVAQNHDFTIEEDLVTDPDQISYAKNEADMRDRWRKRIKYELLEMGSDKIKLEGKAAQDKISKRYHRLSKRMKQTDHDELLEMYLTALTTSYDPHTTYMSADSLNNFEIQMRLNLEGIGAALQDDDGETVVKKVIPGGAAAKDSRLKPEDRIVGVGQGADGPIVNVAEMKLNDVVKLIRGHQGTTVRLAVIPKG
jgi:carboxyl-terminal processing protease